MAIAKQLGITPGVVVRSYEFPSDNDNYLIGRVVAIGTPKSLNWGGCHPSCEESHIHIKAEKHVSKCNSCYGTGSRSLCPSCSTPKPNGVYCQQYGCDLRYVKISDAYPDGWTCQSCFKVFEDEFPHLETNPHRSPICNSCMNIDLRVVCLGCEGNGTQSESLEGKSYYPHISHLKDRGVFGPGIIKIYRGVGNTLNYPHQSDIL